MRRRACLAFGGNMAIAWSMAARAQGRTYRLAILTQVQPVDPSSGKPQLLWIAFFDELRRLGYDEGRNLVVTWYSSEGDTRHVAELARHVVALEPDVIYSPDARMVNALKATTTTIPIVAATTDPVGSGLAVSLARPGRNITGFTVDAGLEIFGKRVALLREAVPAAKHIAWLTPRRVFELTIGREIREVFRSAGLTPLEVVLDAPVDEAGYRRAFASMIEHGADSFWLGPALEHLTHRRVIAELAIAAKLPGMFVYRENVEVGGLMSYGNDTAENFRRSADYIGRILKGTNPADMPFQQPMKFELVLNLKTAETLGLTIPPAILARADEVIE